MNPSHSVLVQIGVRAQLQRQIGDVNLNEGQGLIQREGLLLTQQETHRHAVTCLQGGCFLVVNIDHGHEIDGLQINALVSAESEMVH